MISNVLELEGGTLTQVHPLREGSMLVLSRKIGEKVVIGDGIVLVVKRILGQRVTFGIEAPQEVRIVRGELPRFDERPGESVPPAHLHSEPQLHNELWASPPR
jgi:carbon storage regulator